MRPTDDRSCMLCSSCTLLIIWFAKKRFLLGTRLIYRRGVGPRLHGRSTDGLIELKLRRQHDVFVLDTPIPSLSLLQNKSLIPIFIPTVAGFRTNGDFVMDPTTSHPQSLKQTRIQHDPTLVLTTLTRTKYRDKYRPDPLERY